MSKILAIDSGKFNSEVCVLDARTGEIGFHGFHILESGAVSRTAKILHAFTYGVQLLTAAGLNLIRRTIRWEPAYTGLREFIRRFYQSIREGNLAVDDDGAHLLVARWIDLVHVHTPRDSMMSSATANA